MRADIVQQAGSRSAAIAHLIPTQMTVGMREVEIKRKRWRDKNRERAAQFFAKHSIPIIVGPGKRFYIVDGHHLARALHDEDVKEVPVSIVADMSALPQGAFWIALETRNWTHPFDDAGRQYDYNDIPKSVGELTDDPFRSLAGALRRAGGYTKDKAPFSEFRWADFLRGKIERACVESDFDLALARAMTLAGSPEALSLPGWKTHPFPAQTRSSAE